MVTLTYQGLNGLFHEHKGIAPIVREAGATIPVVSEFDKAGVTAVRVEDESWYIITLGKIMPKGIVAVHINKKPHLALRMEDEPPWPGEYPDYWQQVDWTPCPKPGAGHLVRSRLCARLPRLCRPKTSSLIGNVDSLHLKGKSNG